MEGHYPLLKQHTHTSPTGPCVVLPQHPTAWKDVCRSACLHLPVRLAMTVHHGQGVKLMSDPGGTPHLGTKPCRVCTSCHPCSDQSRPRSPPCNSLHFLGNHCQHRRRCLQPTIKFESYTHLRWGIPGISLHTHTMAAMCVLNRSLNPC